MSAPQPHPGFNQKLLLKGGTAISLHERFTRLTKEPLPPPPQQQHAHSVPPQQQQTRDPFSSVSFKPMFAGGAVARPRAATRHPVYDEEDDYDDGVGRFNGGGGDMLRPRARSAIPDNPLYRPGVYYPPNYQQQNRPVDRRQLFRAALKIKNRAIAHRLGPRPGGGDVGYYGNGGGAEYGNYSRPYFGYGSRGYGNRRYYRGGGGGWGRGWRGGRGGRRRTQSVPQVSKEQLDEQLDAYMAEGKGEHLDKGDADMA